jgi:hypothetical protein
MSHTADTPIPIGRRAWIGFVAADLALFLLANVTAKNSSHPGTSSNLFFVAFVIGAVLLIVLGVITLVHARRRQETK